VRSSSGSPSSRSSEVTKPRSRPRAAINARASLIELLRWPAWALDPRSSVAELGKCVMTSTKCPRWRGRRGRRRPRVEAVEWIREGEIFLPEAPGGADRLRAWRPWVLEEADGALRMRYAGDGGTTSRTRAAAGGPGGAGERRGV